MEWAPSSCRTINTDILDPFLPPLSIIHCFRLVFKAISCIGTEQLYVGSSWSSCLCSSMWRGPWEHITYKFVPTSPAVSCMSGSSNLDSFCDGWLVAVQLLLSGVLPPGHVQYCLKYCVNSCVHGPQMRSIFQPTPSSGPHTSSIDIAVFGSYWVCWFANILWHINFCELLNVKSCLRTHRGFGSE